MEERGGSRAEQSERSDQPSHNSRKPGRKVCNDFFSDAYISNINIVHVNMIQSQDKKGDDQIKSGLKTP